MHSGPKEASTFFSASIADNNQFVKGMREFKQCVEREKIVFNVEVKDPNAPVDFYKNGEKIVPDGQRVEVKNLGNGKHQVRENYYKQN